jgi:hypothetical protein
MSWVESTLAQVVWCGVVWQDLGGQITSWSLEMDQAWEHSNGGRGATTKKPFAYVSIRGRFLEVLLRLEIGERRSAACSWQQILVIGR